MKIVKHLKLREKGQLTIPSKIRAHFQLKKGTELIVLATDKEIILRPKISNPLAKAGMLGKEEEFTRVKDLIARLSKKVTKKVYKTQ